MTYIATFFSHFGAIRYKKLCEQAGYAAKTMPVPRTLSSSCGTCVRCEGGYVAPTGVCAQEVDRIAEVRDGGYWVNPGNQTRLLLLAESIQETLQRYAIVLTRVLAQPRIEAEQLEADGLMMAERLGTLHGINAPEFFDQKLFSTLIHTLRSEGYLDTGCKPDLGRFQALADNIVPLLSNKIRRTIQAGNQL